MTTRVDRGLRATASAVLKLDDQSEPKSPGSMPDRPLLHRPSISTARHAARQADRPAAARREAVRRDAGCERSGHPHRNAGRGRGHISAPSTTLPWPSGANRCGQRPPMAFASPWPSRKSATGSSRNVRCCGSPARSLAQPATYQVLRRYVPAGFADSFGTGSPPLMPPAPQR